MVAHFSFGHEKHSFLKAARKFKLKWKKRQLCEFNKAVLFCFFLPAVQQQTTCDPCLGKKKKAIFFDTQQLSCLSALSAFILFHLFNWSWNKRSLAGQSLLCYYRLLQSNEGGYLDDGDFCHFWLYVIYIHILSLLLPSCKWKYACNTGQVDTLLYCITARPKGCIFKRDEKMKKSLFFINSVKTQE